MHAANIYKPWASFASLQDASKTDIPLSALIELAQHRQPERVHACGVDPLEVLPAYAQTTLVYASDNTIHPANAAAYALSPAEDRVNKFTRAYHPHAPLLLHRKLADIVVDAAVILHRQHGWKLRVYDGLRTMEAAYVLYQSAKPEWLGFDAQGNKTLPALLSEPGASAHNRAFAVDSVLVDAKGREIERFDNTDMTISHRDYAGNGITALQRQARRIKECAFQRAALANGLLLAPLMSEYWDDRLPGSAADLWRVIRSLCRCLGLPAPAQKAMDYETFCGQWRELGEDRLHAAFGEAALAPPPYDAILFHESFNVIYDAQLPSPWKQAIGSPVD